MSSSSTQAIAALAPGAISPAGLPTSAPSAAGAMVNAVDLAKRALVKLLKGMAVLYDLTVTITRNSPDPEVARHTARCQ